MFDDIKAVFDHFRSEGRVIKDAPIAFLLSVLFVGGLLWALFEYHYSGLIDDQRTHIALLEDQAKGMVSPDSKRENIASKLHELYSLGYTLIENEPKFPGQLTEEYRGNLALWYMSVIKWHKDTYNWINDNLGNAGAFRFEKISNNIARDWEVKVKDTSSPISGELILSEYEGNLEVIIQNPSWDNTSSR